MWEGYITATRPVSYGADAVPLGRRLRAGYRSGLGLASRMPLRFAPLQRFPHSPAPAAGPVRPAHSPSTCGRTQLAGGEGRGRWRGLRVGSVPGWGALGGCVGGRISTPTVRAQDRRPVARRLSEVSAAPSVVVGARCAGEVAGGQPHALLGPLARREQRRARGGDGRRLALRQGSEGTHTHRSHRRARVGRVQGGRGLQQMLAEKAAERERDEQKRARIDDEVSKLMDNGVRINPLLRARYGPASGAS